MPIRPLPDSIVYRFEGFTLRQEPPRDRPRPRRPSSALYTKRTPRKLGDEITVLVTEGTGFVGPHAVGGGSIVDVRDLAEIIAAALETGRGPRCFMAGGHFASWSELADLCDALTGRRTLHLPVPGLLLRGIGRLLDAAKRIVPFTYPLTHEAAVIMTRLVPCDSLATIEQLGVPFRPTTETLHDTIRWLYETGAISAKIAGEIANSRA